MVQGGGSPPGQSRLIPRREEIEEVVRPLTGTARIKAAQTVVDFANLLEAAAPDLLSERLDPVTTRRLLSRLGELAETQAGQSPEMADLWRRVQDGIGELANAPEASGAANFELRRARRAWIDLRSTMARILDRPLHLPTEPEPKGFGS